MVHADSAVHPSGEIIGVVRNANYESLKTTPEPATFLPYRRFPTRRDLRRSHRTPAQQGWSRRSGRWSHRSILMCRCYELGTMNAAVAASMSQSRFYTVLLTAFAAIALLLATLGVYGVISYAVSQQTRDFGIRIALGAGSHDVVNLVLGRGALLILPGLAAGILGALFLTRTIRESFVRRRATGSADSCARVRRVRHRGRDRVLAASSSGGTGGSNHRDARGVRAKPTARPTVSASSRLRIQRRRQRLTRLGRR